MTGDDWGTAYADLATAQMAIQPIGKGRTARIRTKDGGSYSYAYADLTDILAAVRIPLAECGFAISQSVSGSEGMVGVVTRLLHRTGAVIASEPLQIPAGTTPQEAGSAVTYARRYSLTALLGISTEDDVDGRQEPAQAKASGPVAGGETAVRVPTPAQDPGPGTTSTDGEAVGEGTGGGSQTSPGATTKDAPGPPHYSLDPSACDHRRTTGSKMLLSPRKSPRGPVCPRCGMSYISITEGTTADLG